MTTTRTRPTSRFRLAATTFTAMVAAAMIVGGGSAALAGPMPEVDVRNVAVDTTVPEQATVSFDYFADYPEEWATPGRSLLTVSIAGPTGSAFHEEIPITSVSESWSRAISLPAGQYNLTINGFEFHPDGNFTIPVHTGTFDVVASPDPTPTPTPTSSPTSTPTPTPTPTETTAPATPAIQLSQPLVAAGGSVTITVSGFAAGEKLELWLHSTPVLLGSGTADANGALIQTVQIPADVAVGAHRIEVRGSNGKSVSADLQVVGKLAATGSDSNMLVLTTLSAAILLVGGAAAGVFASRRRRTHAS